MVGSVRGSMVSTEDLAAGTTVSVDHENYEVTALTSLKDGSMAVAMASEFGGFEEIEVGPKDLREPIWEVV